MIRILLADDQDLLCEILKTSLESQPDLEIVGRASNGEMAVEKVDLLRPDIALIDINMPVMNGLTATERIVQNFPETKVIILSGSDGESFRQNAIEAGAKNYLTKTAKANDIINCIRSIYRESRTARPESEQIEIMMQIAQVRKEVKNYVRQIDLKLNQVQHTEARIKQYCDEIAKNNGQLSGYRELKSKVEPLVQDINRIAKESNKHSAEINRIQNLIEGQLSYVHSLNKRAKKIQQYLLITCVLSVIAIVISLVGLFS